MKELLHLLKMYQNKTLFVAHRQLIFFLDVNRLFKRPQDVSNTCF